MSPNVLRKQELAMPCEVGIDRFFEEPVDADAALPILKVWGRQTLKWQILFGLGLCRVHNFLRRDDPTSWGAKWNVFLFQLGVSKATVSRRVALVRELLSFFEIATLETYSFPDDEMVLMAWRKLNDESFEMKHFEDYRRQALLSDYCPSPTPRLPGLEPIAIAKQWHPRVGDVIVGVYQGPKYLKPKKKDISVDVTGIDDFILALQRQIRLGKVPFRPREYEEQCNLLSMLAKQYDERSRYLRLLLSEIERLHEGKAKSGKVRLQAVMWSNLNPDQDQG
jgi:hypothetical protein